MTVFQGCLTGDVSVRLDMNPRALCSFWMQHNTVLKLPCGTFLLTNENCHCWLNAQLRCEHFYTDTQIHSQTTLFIPEGSLVSRSTQTINITGTVGYARDHRWVGTMCTCTYRLTRRSEAKSNIIHTHFHPSSSTCVCVFILNTTDRQAQ